MMHPEKKHLIRHAPVTLTPSPFPKAAFEAAHRIQPSFNTLYHRLVQDDAFIEEHIGKLADTDEFTQRLYDIWKETLPLGKQVRTIVVSSFIVAPN